MIITIKNDDGESVYDVSKIKLKELKNNVNRIYIEEFYDGDWDCNEEPLFLDFSTGEFYQ